MKNIIKYCQNAINRDEAFSLTELLVVLSLMGLLAGFASTMYLFGANSMNRWRANMQLQNELHTLLQGIGENVYKAEAIGHTEEHALALELPGGAALRYEWIEHSLFRNGRRLNKPEIEVVSFRAALAEESRLVQIGLALAFRGDTLGSRRTVTLRKPALWTIIKREY